MTKSFFYMTLCLFILFTSCTDNTDLDSNLSSRKLKLDMGETKMKTQEEAIDILYSFIDDLNTQNGVYTKSSRNSIKINGIKSVSALSYSGKSQVALNKLRSVDSADSIPVYEFNIEEANGKSGFAVMLADKRFDDVLAYSTDGSLSDTTFNVGLSLLLSRISDYVEILNGESVQEYADWLCNSVTGTEKYIKRFASEADYKSFFQNNGYYGEWDKREYQARFIPVKWKQTAPYNSMTPIFNGQHAKAGCGAIALGQLMTYYKKPQGYDWNLLTQTSTIETVANGGNQARINEVSRLLYDIGKPGVGYINYTPTGSSIQDYNIWNVLKLFGYVYAYDSSARYANFPNATTILTELTNGYPVLIGADEYYSRIDPIKKELGHVWIIDGIFRKERDRYFVEEILPTNNNSFYRELWSYRERFTQVHCNWGWGGSSDGWYSHRLFTPINEPYKFDKNFVLFLSNPQ